MFLINRQNKEALPLDRVSFRNLELTEVNDLQEWIAGNPQILGEELLIIQKEFAGFSDTNERLDLLALDEDGKIVVIENKLDDSGRDVAVQALKYASYCAMLTKSQICEIYQKYLRNGASATEKISEFFDGRDYDSIELNHGENSQRIILVAANFRKEITSAVLWLRNFGVDITCIKLTLFKDGDKLYLDTEQIIPLKEAQSYQIGLEAKKKEEMASAGNNQVYLRFWEKALPVLREMTGLYNNVSPSRSAWISGASGQSGVSFDATIRKHSARANIFIRIAGNPEKTKWIFHKLKETIGEHNNIWRWIENPKTCGIAIDFDKYGFADEERWDEVIEFLGHNIALLIKTFKPALDSIRRENNEI